MNTVYSTPFDAFERLYYGVRAILFLKFCVNTVNIPLFSVLPRHRLDTLLSTFYFYFQLSPSLILSLRTPAVSMLVRYSCAVGLCHTPHV